ncbi:L,D-transpeptidase [Flavobacterium sp. XN-5]|uniref:L,D-transpeptidase n=1 Tax=Flavobacterium sp. XN-5 TaxID=2599390 RepID=UPI0011CB7029|nr:L,D-transpeptidase [Flavobacterium sp. XN-5]NGY35963.1 L,D-transpeptidase [Flavobacterium sp. XN-5]
MKKTALLLNIIVMILLVSCKQQGDVENNDSVDREPAIKRQEPKNVSYRIENTKQWLAANTDNSKALNIAYAVNRTDATNLKLMDSIIVPEDVSGDVEFYLPFPLTVPYLKDIKKIVFFSYPTQTFAAYEKGQLVYSGPTNMGREKDQTPRGLSFTNWKAEETTSTFNDEWELRWNFNIENKLGVGWHQYELPGYPASHSCLRLQEKDAKFMYKWADEWQLADSETVKVKGTPVIVFGNYDFSAPKPWLQLTVNSKGLDISENEIKEQTMPFLTDILKEQKNRQKVQTAKI